ncbi:MAG: 1-(5-phosphoribosyl)-5-[(5-phosphoribosylamino)methylideneamino]imidazole-4-carboxamide isomerase [Candidatus Paraprevotella stercoravium]|uniref:1-(5-phosphoribosyl)-5-[(5-phosphoribosylamino)methylideneamino] imidazole-4-carboxamide isomerase n=1 Tax=Candidatus Paraprevotella stercoravium TaxID=2838725 RepID=A0A9E2P182_9BACT|nr:1-(5-phosphoribosyl)-5-[(5-phosphoribosylamino)methylideneamino]imidazole-4-carboxamide isomerase [Candidatus Paraprevotella stercoravium]
MIELIPAIDLIGGKCVRLTKGDYDTQKVYNEDPVAVAREFEEYGFKRLHVVDLDGARSKHVVNHKVLERMAQATNLIIDFGGGIKTDEDIRIATESGAQMVTVGSVAVTQPDLFLGWLQQLGSERIILGADVKNGRISINGWKEDSSDELIPFLDKYIQKGVQKVLCTEISKDGTLQGPATALYREIMTQFPQCHLIASGGVSSMNDLQELDQAGIPAVVFGKAIYEGRIALKDLALWMEENR